MWPGPTLLEQKTQPAHHAFWPDNAGNQFLAAQSVLHQQDRPRRRQECRQVMVLGRLQGHDDNVARRQRARIAVGVDDWQCEIAVF